MFFVILSRPICSSTKFVIVYATLFLYATEATCEIVTVYQCVQLPVGLM
jgi:hypothetical protein